MKLKNLIAGVCALCGFAVSAQAEMVSYWDPIDKVTRTADAIVVTAGTTTLGSGWYVVKGEVVCATTIGVTGTANLILADGAKLTARDSTDYHPGIKVSSGVTLNMYAQSVDADKMGQLSAIGGDYAAGIGGAGEGGTCGTVNIYGGHVAAKGGEYAAGIGGGGHNDVKGGTGGNISIYGGIVTANGENGGADIGGGNRADGGNISIYGGEVIADNTKGDSEGAGIGGGYAGAGGTILIAGGKVMAVGGYKDDGGAGIGGGENGAGGTITITGGIVNATGTDYGAGIGGGDEGAGGDVTISGGTVVAKAGKSSVWDIGSGSGGGDKTGEFVVTGGSVLLANSGLCRDGYPKNSVGGTQVYGAMILGLEADAAVELEGLAGYGTNDIFADANGCVSLYLPADKYSFTANGKVRNVTVSPSATVETVSYWDPVGKVTRTADATVVTADTTTLTGGWYVVTGKVDRRDWIQITGTDESPANLILADEAKLTVYPAADHRAALHVPTGKALSIWAARENGSGAIEAKGRYQGAGIGGFGNDGSSVESCGTVNIYGGNVTAIGSMYAAGIGGGGRSDHDGGTGGRISIYGGKVVRRALTAARRLAAATARAAVRLRLQAARSLPKTIPVTIRQWVPTARALAVAFVAVAARSRFPAAGCRRPAER